MQVERPLDFTLLPFDDRQQKISGDKSERPLIENRYSPYRPVAVIRVQCTDRPVVGRSSRWRFSRLTGGKRPRYFCCMKRVKSASYVASGNRLASSASVKNSTRHGVPAVSVARIAFASTTLAGSV
jgi:hypothetical protein